MKHIAVIIPCYNESPTIIQIIDSVHTSLPSAQIYVFDNNSTDNSFSLVKDKIAKITNGGGNPLH